ncbi:MAG: hypothetical protein HQL62_05680, partial [Magnetococcales bacterium]|nr:hypothetical protein [Magnetococcales bacterium]
MPSRRAAQLLLLFLLLLYARVIFGDWVNWDDLIYFLNPHLQDGFSPAFLRWAWADTDTVHQWIPVTWMSIQLDRTLFGVNPAGSHLVNLAIHATNTLLLLYLLHRMTARFWPSLAVAALFALHPQHVEAVAWATERKELLAALFGLLSLHQYVIFARARDANLPGLDSRVVRPLALSLVCYFLSLLAKPMWITLPALLLLLDGWPLGRLRRPWLPLLLEKVFYLPIMIGIMWVTFRVYETPSFAPDGVSFLDLLPYALVNDIHYLVSTFWPVGLAPLYPFPLVRPGLLEVGGAVGLLLAGTALVWRLARSRPWLLLGWLWFGTLLLVSGVIHAGRHATTDRFTYLPHMGLFTALVWEVDAWATRWRLRPQVMAGATGLLLMVCAFLTWNQIGFWRDSMTLWSHTVATTR